MTRTIFTKTRLALSVVAVMTVAAPVSASLWAGEDGAKADFARLDAMTRIGDAQLATDPYCDARPVVLMNLTDSYDERLKSSVAQDDGALLDIWASDDLGTWTAVYTRHDGIACVAGSGVGWTPGMSPEAALAQVSA